MKKVLFIGSIVLDMIVTLDHLPKLKEDINTDGIKFSVGGCCHNASQIVKHFDIPTIVCSPIGTGHFASLLKSMLDEKPFVQVKDQDNGVCMCLVDKNGERTFLSEHGVEYQFNEEWLKDIKFEDLDYIYICGLEIEDVSGNKIIDYIEKSNVKVFFAPGSRFMHIPEDRMNRILDLQPILHLNDDEALQLTKCNTVKEAANQLFKRTHELVIITCGSKGVYYKNKDHEELVEGFKTIVKDTIGAGDSHAGACLAGLALRKDLKDIMMNANKIASKVVSIEGAKLSKEQFEEVMKR